MRPVVGDSGDSTAGCPKFFTYEDTEFLGYDADAADGVGKFVSNFRFPDKTINLPVGLGIPQTTCSDVATIALANCHLLTPNCGSCPDLVGPTRNESLIWREDCGTFCDIQHDLRVNVSAAGTIETTNSSSDSASFFRDAAASDTIGTDCEPFAIKFACFDGARELTSVYTDYIGFAGDRMNPQSTLDSLAHILHDTLVVVHDHGNPLPASLRCEIEGPRELCFGPPSGTKGGTNTGRNNADQTQCPAREGDPCFGLDQTACDGAPAEDLCVFTSLGVCARSFPCSGREITLGAPGVRSCGIPGLHDLGFETTPGTSVHTTRPYSQSTALYSECLGTDASALKDPYYNDEPCTGYEAPFSTCNVLNKADPALYPDGVPFPAYWDYTQQGAFFTATGSQGAQASLSASLYEDKFIQQDNGQPAAADYVAYAAAVQAAGFLPGPVSAAGLLNAPTTDEALTNGCGFSATADCITHYPSVGANESALANARTPVLLRTHYGGQGSGICYPVQGSSGVPFGTNGVDEFNTRARKSLPSTYNPYFKQEVTLDLSCGVTDTLVKGNRYGMLEIDGFVRSDNTDDTACGTCAGSDPSMNAVCVGDAAESSNDFRLSTTRNICHLESDTLVIQESCSGQNRSCEICGDHDNSGRAKTKLTSLTFRWTPSGAVDASVLSLDNITVEGSTVVLGSDGTFQTVTVTAVGANFGANTDFTIAGSTTTLHTSCSQPIFVGLGIQFTGPLEGALIVIGFATLDGRTDSDCVGNVVTSSDCDLCTTDSTTSGGSGGMGMGMGSKARLEQLTFQWTPTDGSTALSSSNFAAEDSSVTFGAFASGTQSVTVTANGGTFGANTDLTAVGDTETLHTSCSQPIFIGLTVTFASGALSISGFRSDVGRTEADCPTLSPTAAPTVQPSTTNTSTGDFRTCTCFTLIRVTEDPLLWDSLADFNAAPKFIRPQCFLAGREGYGVNSASLENSPVHDVFDISASRISAPCCPHFWVTCAASFWAVADSKENEMDYLGFGPGNPTDSQSIAMFNSGVQIGTPNCAIDPTSQCCAAATCCGVEALTEFTIHLSANLPGYCYTQEALFKNAPDDRDLVTTEAQTCAVFEANGGTVPTCAALPTASFGVAGAPTASAVSTVFVGVALGTIAILGAAVMRSHQRSSLRALRKSMGSPVVENSAFEIVQPKPVVDAHLDTVDIEFFGDLPEENGNLEAATEVSISGEEELFGDEEDA